MSLAADIVTWTCIITGSALALIGALGMIRLPDTFARMHAAGIIDTLGVGLILVGLIFQAGWSAVTIKLLLILVFIFITSPTATHALAQAALNGGLKPLLGKKDGKEKPSKT
ncbi:MAG: monovalent cation/H(+) antiporter subunit G [Rhodospirillales bacterium]|jgi:multicomponent Na+:H+ antiporter subunit G|nr:monovalent cation/H(+) antiporter subunit G [Rhodospirillales bacterium]